MNDLELLRYSRHILLSEIDLQGQEKIINAHILIIGCGGLGNAAIPLLVASGIGELTIVDFDDVELSNLQRQVHFTSDDIGKPKTVSLKKHMLALNPNVKINMINSKVDKTLLTSLMHNVDIILDCTDNFATRVLINQVAIQFKMPLVSGAAIRFEGQLAVYDFRDKQNACYQCLFEGEHADDGNCALLGVFAPVLQIIGATQAQEALKLILGLSVVTNQLKIYNALTSEWQQFKFSKNPTCPICHI